MFRFTIVSGIIGIASESSHNGNWVDGKLANGIMMTIAAILFVCNGLDLIFLSLTRKIFKGMNLTIRKKIQTEPCYVLVTTKIPKFTKKHRISFI